MIVLGVISHAVRLVCLKRLYPRFSMWKYFISFVIPAIFVTIMTTYILLKEQSFLAPSFLRVVLLTVSSIVLVMAFAYFLGLTSIERASVNKLIVSYLKIRKR